MKTPMRLSSFLTLLLLVVCAAPAPACEKGRQDLRPHRSGGPGMPGLSGGLADDLADGLDLTEEQRTALRALQEEARTELEPLHQKLRDRVRELRHSEDLQRGPGLREALAADAQVQGLREQIHSLRREHGTRVQGLLSPEQIETLRELRTEDHRGHRRPGPRQPRNGPGLDTSGGVDEI